MKINSKDCSTQTIVNNDNKEERPKSNTLSILASYGAYKLVDLGRKKSGDFAIKSDNKLNLEAQNLNMYNAETCANIFEASGLKEKGCRINNLATNDVQNVEHKINNFNKMYSKLTKESYVKKLDKAIAEGNTKKIYKYKEAIKTSEDLMLEMELAEKLSQKLSNCNFSKANIGSLKSTVYNELINAGFENPSQKVVKRISENVINNIKVMKDYKIGTNAGYSPFLKEVCINLEKAGSALPHELGHAKTHLTSKIGKYLPYIASGAVKFAPLALAAAILLKPKDKREDEDKSGIINKTGNFFKDNCVAITSLAFLPQLIDEANASIQGHKIAQKVLPKDTLKHLARTNTMAFLTYAISAIGMVLATFVADKVRNATC